MGAVTDQLRASQRSLMEETQRKMMARQIELQACQMRERQMALQIARQRDLFGFIATFCATAFPLMAWKARTTPAAAAPILPLSFVLAYRTCFVLAPLL